MVYLISLRKICKKAMFNKTLLFLKSQIDQIREGGVRILYKKLRKLVWLSFMNILTPLAVHFGVNWPKAYYFIGMKHNKTLKEIRMQPNVNKLNIDRIRDQVVRYLKKFIDFGPEAVDPHDWFNACKTLGWLYFSQGKMDELSDLYQKVSDAWCSIAKGYQVDDLEIEYLPRKLAVGAIGDYEHLEAYVKAGILGLHPNKKLVLLLNPKENINNSCYLDYWRSHITIISDPIMQKRIELPLIEHMLLDGKMFKSFLALGIIRERWIRDERPALLTLSDEDYGRGWQCLKTFGVQKNDWFVCLHARESGFKNSKLTVEDYRNADINSYITAIKAITDAGGWVVRMGDSSMKPLPELPHVIDYAHSDEKSDWMDVFLCAQCRFFIGTSSGLYTFAMSYGTPVVLTNLLPTCGAYYLTSNDLFIPRICRFKAKERFLNFNESFSPQMGTAAIQYIYDHKDIEIIENSEEEIKDLVEEMLDRCDGKLTDSEEDDQLQSHFKSVTLDCGKLYGPENAVVNARIGRTFLRKYAELLPSRGSVETALEANQGKL